MTFLPIVERELRVRARLRSTYRLRLLAAGSAIALIFILMPINLYISSGANFGKGIFETLANLAFAYCLIEGARNTADSLSREKREGTLGLLFLTDLKGYDVVFGKLAANSVNSFFGLLAIFPALAIPLVLGGVTAGEFWRHVLSLINALFVSLTLGLLASAACRNEQRTWTLSLLSILGLTIGPALLLNLPSSPLSVLAPISPYTAFLGATDAVFAATSDQFHDSIVWGQTIGWLALVGASVLLPRAWQDRPVQSRTRAAASPGSPGAERKRRLRRARLINPNPALWLAARADGTPVGLWMFVIAASSVAVLSCALDADLNAASAGLLLFLMWIVHLTISVWVASDACHALGAARDSGALDLLLCTPLTTRQIVNGYLRGIKRTFFRPIAVLVTVELAVYAAHYYVACDGEYFEFGPVIFTLSFVILTFAAVLELQAVATFGLWAGLVRQRPAQALTRTILFVVVLPWFAVFSFPVYPILAVMKNFAFTGHAYDQLLRRFRSIVTERFDGAKRAELVTDPTRRAQRGQLPAVAR